MRIPHIWFWILIGRAPKGHDRFVRDAFNVVGAVSAILTLVFILGMTPACADATDAIGRWDGSGRVSTPPPKAPKLPPLKAPELPPPVTLPPTIVCEEHDKIITCTEL